MNFVVSVIHAVAQLDQAAAFFAQVLDFKELDRGEDWIAMENGALAVRLVTTTAARREAGELELEMSTQDVQEAATEFLQQKNIQLLTDTTWVSPEREEMRLRAPHGIVITLSRIYDEDELGVLPDLPTSLDWDEDAECCIKRLLRFVPVNFRHPARRRSTERAEMLAVSEGNIAVDKATALRGLVQSTPGFQHQRLRQELLREGIDPDPLFMEIDE